MSGDPHHLGRFVQAQTDTYDTALAELKAGAKRSHWMWYIFPQLACLGRSERARYYGIASLAEAAAYIAHDLLGPRLREAVDASLVSGETDPSRLFGSPDDLKYRSCLTLFALAAPQEPIFRHAIDRFYDSRPDELTLKALGTTPEKIFA